MIDRLPEHAVETASERRSREKREQEVADLIARANDPDDPYTGSHADAEHGEES